MYANADPNTLVQVTARGRYAVGAVLHIALHDEIGPVPLAEISVCQNISTSYVDQIFADLRPHRIIEGIPGPGGGYRLARPASEVTVAEIIAAVERREAGTTYRSALEGAVWSRLMADIAHFMERLTVADLVERPAAREWLARQYQTGPWRCEVCGVLTERGPKHPTHRSARARRVR
ncbi:Rrf2 family transcriptional regulator [Halorhodospira halophila]|uniref:Transcriptional regulator, BadM/Rrf2 family n=1 Tax=Halorhodospira halophila (strain DSM 244 / SL1) TaxID=349124 RepID=A1WTB5_HALHL|nr:Rrf2 family transcriptional regulator [Halorhodospira halophila]ABM60927.1 transcriptional regulator, BadM/Rrf2 family [Halorhodospira halophila SL1]MBK1728585.1 Rrf2 family transcriptional regulator [Halorhodospira halophila]